MLVSAVWLAPAAFAAIDRLAQSRLQGEATPGAQQLIWAGGDWLVYAILVPPVFAVSSRWPIAKPYFTRRALLHLLFAVLFCVAWATCGKLLQAALGFIFRRQELQAMIDTPGFGSKLTTDWLSWVFTTLPFGCVVYFSIASIAHAIRYFTEVSDRELQVARLSDQLSTARFSALQAQLNPHFLFNTLNTIAVRARDGDGPGTARMVEQLSDILRRTLNRDRANEVTLGEELDLVRQYLAIEQARFSDRLRPVFQIDAAVTTALVPSFALQHLVENAIRHGIARRSEAGRVRVTARRIGDTLEMSVADDGPGIDPGAASVGHGIENTRERLRSLYGDRGSLEVVRADLGGTTATLRVPYRVRTESPGAAN
jgi:sensor histidine kinase YesM